MKQAFIIEINSSGWYFMTSIKGRNFRHNGRAQIENRNHIQSHSKIGKANNFEQEYEMTGE